MYIMGLLVAACQACCLPRCPHLRSLDLSESDQLTDGALVVAGQVRVRARVRVRADGALLVAAQVGGSPMSSWRSLIVALTIYLWR